MNLAFRNTTRQKGNNKTGLENKNILILNLQNHGNNNQLSEIRKPGNNQKISFRLLMIVIFTVIGELFISFCEKADYND